MYALGEAGRYAPLPFADGGGGALTVESADAAKDTEASGTKESSAVSDSTTELTTPDSDNTMDVTTVVPDTTVASDTGSVTKGGSGSVTKGAIDKTVIFDKVFKLASNANSSNKLREAAITCAGTLCIGESPHPLHGMVIERLGNLAKVKSVEIQFSVGTAFCCLGAGSDTTAAIDPWHLSDPTAAKNAVSIEAPTTTDTTDTTNTAVDTSADEAGATAAVQGSAPADGMGAVLAHILDKWVRHPRAGSRQAAGVWLVTMLKHCGTKPAVQARLYDIQGAFSDLLSEGMRNNK